jgi:ABC-type nickel/cobalt efflux system permease component RcnA
MLPLFRSKKTLSALLLAVAAIVALPLLTASSKAAAHPLGNFTINHYSRIELGPDALRLRYVLDIAEIPTFQERDAIDGNGDGSFSEVEKDAYLKDKVENLRHDLDLKLDGAAVVLSALDGNLSFPPGQGGLDTQRIEIDFTAPVRNASSHAVEYHDNTYSDRIGWREVVVRGLDGVRIANSTAAAQDVSNELHAYPQNSISNPLDVTSATVSYNVDPGAVAAAPPQTSASSQTRQHERAVRGNPDSTLARYAGLIAKDRLSASVVIFALLAAVGFGAVHALSPGHGKTIVGAYLVGSRGTWRHALLLALTVTVTHTSSVYALGFVTLYLSQYIVPEKLYPWLGVGSGALIVLMGLTLIVARLRTSGLFADALSWLRLRPRLTIASESGAIALPARAHHHGRTDHDHAHEDEAAPHSHGFGPAHTHAMPGQDGEAISWRSLIGLGIFGGLLPCPSAIVVMLSAIALHRIAFGLILILAFSVGLASVLTGIGFVLVYAGAISKRLPFLARLQSRFASAGAFASFTMRALPVGSAAAVFAAGMIVLLRALAQQGAI